MTITHAFTIGYDLDGGGYEFIDAPHIARDAIGWDSPDLDYILGTDMCDGMPDYLAITPNYGFSTPTELPTSFVDPDGTTYTQVQAGWLGESDHDCNCHGKPNDPDVVGAAGEGPWEFTGDTGDDPHPDCTRCEGSGYIDSPGGQWALYVIDDDDY